MLKPGLGVCSWGTPIQPQSVLSPPRCPENLLSLVLGRTTEAERSGHGEDRPGRGPQEGSLQSVSLGTVA